ncbi:MAG: cytochrome ubiquinol oxidase subunit I, partial [Chloroflexales bacterium]|nr:cytochrome ubiquinol oxidase subunit I [Chloroflexales bacterium]
DFPPADWPPLAVTFLSFHHMVILGILMLLVGLAGLWLLWRGRLEGARWWQGVAASWRRPPARQRRRRGPPSRRR